MCASWITPNKILSEMFSLNIGWCLVHSAKKKYDWDSIHTPFTVEPNL